LSSGTRERNKRYGITRKKKETGRVKRARKKERKIIKKRRKMKDETNLSNSVLVCIHNQSTPNIDECNTQAERQVLFREERREQREGSKENEKKSRDEQVELASKEQKKKKSLVLVKMTGSGLEEEEEEEEEEDLTSSIVSSSSSSEEDFMVSSGEGEGAEIDFEEEEDELSLPPLPEREDLLVFIVVDHTSSTLSLLLSLFEKNLSHGFSLSFVLST
jgi:hypothetical protein